MGQSSEVGPAVWARVVDQAAELVGARYVDAERAADLARMLRTKAADGGYDDAGSPIDLVAALTADMQAMTGDQHLRVNFHPAHERTLRRIDGQSPGGEGDRSSDTFLERWVHSLVEANFGFTRVERLRGNVGYLVLRTFAPPELGGEAAVSALNFLGGARAVLVDLRQCKGGYSRMVQLIASFFLDSGPRPFCSYVYRDPSRDEHYSNLPYVPGRRLTTCPLYLLTSRSVFSAAEEFTYTLKALDRCVVVGERTGGGAHIGRELALIDGFTMFLPVGRAHHPLTGTNWESTGITPDIAVPAARAQHVAHREALTMILNTTGDEVERRAVAWELDIVDADYDPPTPAQETLRSYVGTYGPREITLEHGVLHHRYRTWHEPLLPLSSTHFAGTFRGNEPVRLRFLTAGDGPAEALQVTYRDDGQEMTFLRCGSPSQ